MMAPTGKGFSVLTKYAPLLEGFADREARHFTVGELLQFAREIGPPKYNVVPTGERKYLCPEGHSSGEGATANQPKTV